MTDFETRTADYIRQHHMLQKGDTVIVALSGGADSMALFRFLLSWRERLGITLRAAHVNHGLRGAGAQNVTQVIFKDSGHFPRLEEAKKYTDTIERFLDCE